MQLYDLKNQERVCNCNVGITNVFLNGKCIKCGGRVIVEKPYVWQQKKVNGTQR